MAVSAQVSIWQNENGETHLEIPYGGGRKKIKLPENEARWGYIISEQLEIQAQWLREQKQRQIEMEQEKLNQTQERAFQIAKERHKRVYKNDPSMYDYRPQRRFISISDLLIED